MLNKLVMMSCATALLAGCAGGLTDSYCSVASPIQFSDADVIDYLMTEDRRLIEQIVAHNETIGEVCR